MSRSSRSSHTTINFNLNITNININVTNKTKKRKQEPEFKKPLPKKPSRQKIALDPKLICRYFECKDADFILLLSDDSQLISNFYTKMQTLKKGKNIPSQKNHISTIEINNKWLRMEIIKIDNNKQMKTIKFENFINFIPEGVKISTYCFYEEISREKAIKHIKDSFNSLPTLNSEIEFTTFLEKTFISQNLNLSEKEKEEKVTLLNEPYEEPEVPIEEENYCFKNYYDDNEEEPKNNDEDNPTIPKYTSPNNNPSTNFEIETPECPDIQCPGCRDFFLSTTSSFFQQSPTEIEYTSALNKQISLEYKK